MFLPGGCWNSAAQLRKWRLRKAQQLAQGHTALPWQSRSPEVRFRAFPSQGASRAVATGILGLDSPPKGFLTGKPLGLRGGVPHPYPPGSFPVARTLVQTWCCRKGTPSGDLVVNQPIDLQATHLATLKYRFLSRILRTFVKHL